MSLYVDASVFLKLYFEEPDSALAERILGAAKVVGGGAVPVVTFDLRRARAARSMGWTVQGAEVPH